MSRQEPGTPLIYFPEFFFLKNAKFGAKIHHFVKRLNAKIKFGAYLRMSLLKCNFCPYFVTHDAAG